MKTAWVAGGSGLVGGVLLRELLRGAAFDRVVSIGRRLLAIPHAKLVEAVVDFRKPGAFDELPPPHVAFSCLGTTIRKAGSREAFRSVDLDAVVSFARAAREAGARTFVHVTALGADPGSRVFYNAVKGEAEKAVASLGFESVYALRPSLLDGERVERRPAESVSLAVGRALGPLLGKYRPTPVKAIAATMVALALAPRPGVHAVEPGAMTGSAPAP